MDSAAQAKFCTACLKYHGRRPKKRPKGRLADHEYVEVGARLTEVARG